MPWDDADVYRKLDMLSSFGWPRRWYYVRLYYIRLYQPLLLGSYSILFWIVLHVLYNLFTLKKTLKSTLTILLARTLGFRLWNIRVEGVGIPFHIHIRKSVLVKKRFTFSIQYISKLQVSFKLSPIWEAKANMENYFS